MKMLTVSLLVCAMMALTAAAAVPEAEKNETVVLFEDNQKVKISTCRDGWTEFNNRCFIYVSTPRTWADAEKNCQTQGGNLASVHSFEEQVEIQSMILRATQGFPVTWLGGSDAAQEGTWLWSDGTPFDYIYWADGQPDNNLNADCQMMNYGDQKKYDDAFCSDKKPSVCAKRSDICLTAENV